MTIPVGINQNAVPVDQVLVSQLDTMHMEKLAPVPKTVMGSVAQPNDPWLRVDANYPTQVQQRLDAWANFGGYVTGRHKKSSALNLAEMELRDKVVHYLTTSYPDYFRRVGKSIISPLTGLSVNLKAVPPLLAVAALTNVDFMIMLPSEADGQGGHNYRLMGGILFSPNNWSLRSKFNHPCPPLRPRPARIAWHAQRDASKKAARLGKTVEEIHRGIVPHFDVHMADRVHRLFNTLRPDYVFWRRNWGLPLTNQLFLHPDVPQPEQPALTPENMYTHGHIRSEHETFIRLPQSNAIAFGIQTYIWPIREALANPKVFNAIATAIEGTSPEMRAYADRGEKLDTLRQLMTQRGAPKAA